MIKNFHKIVAFIFTLTTSFALVSCNNASSSNSIYDPSQSKLESKKIFDWYHDGTYPTLPFKFTLSEFGDTPFNVSSGMIITQPGTNLKIEGASALYVCDVNGDGYRDFCLSGSTATKPYADYSYIYDLKNQKQIFYIIDTTVNVYNDYHFSMSGKSLVLTKDRCDKSAVVLDTYAKGIVNYSQEKGVFVKWSNVYGFNDCQISLSLGGRENKPLSKNEENGVSVVNVDTHSLYCFTIKYHGDGKLNSLYEMENVVSFAYRVENLNNVKVVRNEYFPGEYKLYFCFTSADNSNSAINYEVQASGSNERYLFKITDDKEQYPLYKALGWSLDSLSKKAIFEYNIADSQSRYSGLRKIGEWEANTTGSDYLIDYLNTTAFEVNEEYISISKVPEYYLTFDKNGSGAYTFEIYDDFFIKANNKCYVVLKDFDGENLEKEAFGFMKGLSNFEITNLVTGEKIAFPNYEGIKAKGQYSPSEYHYPSSEQFTYKINVGQFGYYIIDATHFIEAVRAPDMYTIYSDINFASLFN